MFREAFPVLKPGGRPAVSDVVNVRPLTAMLAADRAPLCGCIAGAAALDDVETWLQAAGLHDVGITVQAESRDLIASWAPGRGIEDHVASAIIEARKPGAR